VGAQRLRLTIANGPVSLPHMSIVLLTNDDGIMAPGLAALEATAQALGTVWVVAPQTERSASSRSVTLDRPLRLKRLGERKFALDGTPADCVLVAVRQLLPELPAVVISGINAGFNLGEDTEYSGTVGAAMEAANQGVKLCLAVSCPAQASEELFKQAADFAIRAAGYLLQIGTPTRSVFNINYPQNVQGVRWCRLGNPLPRGKVVVGEDPRGKPYYWIAERPDEADPPPDTDRGAVRRGMVSLCLLALDRDYKGEWVPPNAESFDLS